MIDGKIKLKNYVYLGLIIMFSILLIYYFYMWYLTYKENKLNSPIMNEYLQVINYSELDNYLMENKDAVVFISVLKDESIRNFEEDFKILIKNKSLKNKILYMDLSGALSDEKVYNSLISNYTINKKSIVDVPCILVFKGGTLEDIFVINEKKYDMSEIKFFFKQEGLFE